jgi:Ca2+:H+ antiporter
VRVGHDSSGDVGTVCGCIVPSLARDTVFAAVMIACTGIIGLALPVATVRRQVAVFNAEGTGGALATVTTLATLATLSLALLLLALVAVVVDAKAVSPSIESTVERVGFPPSFVGVVIAMLVLLPETLAALRAARRDRVQTSLNLALGSAMASIGLTIPAIAAATIRLDGPLVLGLGGTQIVLLALTALIGVLTVVPGRATLLQGGVHVALFAAFIALAVSP